MTADAHEKVIWFDVSVDEVLCVYILNSADHLKMEKKPPLNKHSKEIRHFLMLKQSKCGCGGRCVPSCSSV